MTSVVPQEGYCTSAISRVEQTDYWIARVAVFRVLSALDNNTLEKQSAFSSEHSEKVGDVCFEVVLYRERPVSYETGGFFDLYQSGKAFGTYLESVAAQSCYLFGLNFLPLILT